MNSENQDKSQGKAAKLLLVTYNMRRASYLVRGMAGAYLVYLMYQLFWESDGQLTLPMALAGVFMMIAGIYFLIGAAYALINGIYSENAPAESEKIQNAANAETAIGTMADESGMPGNGTGAVTDVHEPSEPVNEL